MHTTKSGLTKQVKDVFWNLFGFICIYPIYLRLTAVLRFILARYSSYAAGII